MKILSISAAVLSLALAAPAFAQSSTTGDTDANPSPAASPNMDTTTGRTGETGMAANGDLKSLLTTLVKDNQDEIAMGKVALTNAKSKLVKDFAKKLIADHSAAAKKVEPIAKAHGVDVAANEGSATEEKTEAATGEAAEQHMPGMSDEGSDKMSKLQALKGAEFDREFASMMIDDHQQALSLLDQVKTAAAGDKQIEKMVDQLKPTMKMHLESSKKLAKVVGSPRHETRGTDTDKDNDTDTNAQPK